MFQKYFFYAFKIAEFIIISPLKVYQIDFQKKNPF